MTDENQGLREAIARVCAEDSFYWLMRHADDTEQTDQHEVEIRIDLDPSIVASFAPEGWTVARRKTADGMLFPRRRQQLTDDAVRKMFEEALTFAVEHNGRFHSWLHDPELPDWSEIDQRM